MNRKPAYTYTVPELASARQHQRNGRLQWPTTIERAVEGGQAATYPEFGFSAGGSRGGSEPAEPGVRHHGMRKECDRSATGVRQA